MAIQLVNFLKERRNIFEDLTLKVLVPVVVVGIVVVVVSIFLIVIRMKK